MYKTWQNSPTSRGERCRPLPREKALSARHMLPMQRRDFLKSGTAAVCVSAFPAVPVAASTPAAAVRPGMYAWAVAAARARGVVCQEVLVESLRLTAAQAAGLMARLETRGVIGTPVLGKARATSPLYPASRVPGSLVGSVRAEAARNSAFSKAESLWPDRPKTDTNAPGTLTSGDADPARPEASDGGRSVE